MSSIVGNFGLTLPTGSECYHIVYTRRELARDRTWDREPLGGLERSREKDQGKCDTPIFKKNFVNSRRKHEIEEKIEKKERRERNEIARSISSF